VVGAGLEELGRHSPSLRPDIVSLCLDSLHALCVLGGRPDAPPPAPPPPEPAPAPAEAAADAAPAAAAEGAEVMDADAGAAPPAPSEAAVEGAAAPPAAVAPPEAPPEAPPAPLPPGEGSAYLVESVTYTARMIEATLGHQDSARCASIISSFLLFLLCFFSLCLRRFAGAAARARGVRCAAARRRGVFPPQSPLFALHSSACLSPGHPSVCRAS
jgi:hypothetical protein